MQTEIGKHWGTIGFMVALALAMTVMTGCGTDGSDSGSGGNTTDTAAADVDAGPTVKCGDGTELKDGECVAKAVATNECGPNTKLVDGICVVDEAAMRPQVAAVKLLELAVRAPSAAGFFALHSAIVEAEFAIDGEAFDTVAVVGLRTADGAKQCTFGVLPIAFAGSKAGQLQTVEVAARLLVQQDCAALAGSDVELFVSFDPFYDVALAGRKEVDPTDANALIAASVLATDGCAAPTNADHGDHGDHGGHGGAHVVYCGGKTKVTKSPGKDLTLAGRITYGDVDIDQDPDLSANGVDTVGSSGGVVLKVESFSIEQIAAIESPPTLPSAVTEVDLSQHTKASDTPLKYEDLQGSGDKQPAVYGTANYTVYGVTKDEEVDGDEISMRYELRPAGVYTDEDEGWETMPSQISLEAKAGEDPTIEEIKEAFLASLQGIELRSVRVPLYFTPELRRKLTIGAWKDAQFFELRGCLDAAFDEAGGDDVEHNNCQIRDAVVLRVEVAASTGAFRALPEPSKAPDVNPGGNDKLHPFEASLPDAANPTYGAQWNMGKNIGVMIVNIALHGFVNLRESTGEQRSNYMSTQRTIKPGMGVTGHATGTGWGPLIDPLRWGNDPAVNAELLISRPWDQPITSGQFGTFEKFQVITRADLFGYNVFDWGIELPMPNIGTPVEVTLLEVTFLKVLSATIATPGDGKNGLKYFLTAGLSKTPGDKKAGKKGTVNGKQKKNLNRPDSVEGVKIEFTANAGVEASITLERKGQTGKLPARLGSLPSECAAGNGRSWLSPDGNHCYFATTESVYQSGAASACQSRGASLYRPTVLEYSTKHLSAKSNIAPSTYMGLATQKKTVLPTADELIAHAWTTDDPLAWIMNLWSALNVATIAEPPALLPGISYGSGAGQCPASCQWSMSTTPSCLWHKHCTVTGAWSDVAYEAAVKVGHMLGDFVGNTNAWLWLDYDGVDYRSHTGVFWKNATNTGAKRRAFAAVAKPTWWQVVRPTWMSINDDYSTQGLEIHVPSNWKSLINYRDIGGAEVPNSHDYVTDWNKDLQQSAWDGYNWNNTAYKTFRDRNGSLGWYIQNVNWGLLDDQNKRIGMKARIIPMHPDWKQPALCVKAKTSLKGQEAESYSIIMTPGSEASAAFSLQFGNAWAGFGADLSLVLYEFAAPVEFRGMRTKDNKKAELAVWQKATLDVLKLKFDVWVKPLLITIKVNLFSNDEGIWHKEWDLWGPIVSSFGCTGKGGSCGYEPNE